MVEYFDTMKYKTHIIAAFLTLLFVPFSAFAQAAPSPVTGVRASLAGNEVEVQWNAVTSDPIEYYRVYYSSESILDNSGLYDDFEVTEDDGTTLRFVPPSGMTMLYVAVIAVTASGLESEFFTEEASVDLTNVAPPGSAQSASSVPMQESTSSSSQPIAKETGTAKLLKGTVVSPTRMVIEFSAPMTVEASSAPQSLMITAPGNKKLQIKNITIEGKIVTINTETQAKGVVYNVQFTEPFMGKDGQMLDASDRSVLLTGHADGREPTQAPAVRTVNPMEPPDLENVTIVPEIQENGGYTVTLTWDIDNTPGDLYGIVAYQTRDGQTFGPPSLLPIEIGGVQLQNVTPGFFGIYLQVMNVYGFASQGVFQYVTLPVYVPGYGFYGDLTFGGMEQGDETNFDAVEVPDNVATMEAMTDDTPTEPLEGVIHSSAFAEAQAGINWKNAAILASSVAGIVILFVGGLSMMTNRRRSNG